MNNMIEYGLLDETLEAYVEWREECTAVRDAYRQWSAAPPWCRTAAFGDYLAALDNEQHAAEIYAELYAALIRRVGERASTGLGRPQRKPRRGPHKI